MATKDPDAEIPPEEARELLIKLLGASGAAWDPEKEKALPLAAQVWEDIKDRTNLRLLEIVEDDLPVHSKVSRIWGDTKGQATSRDCALVLTHVDGAPDLSRTNVDWEEPYKDGGPDAAHERLKMARLVA